MAWKNMLRYKRRSVITAAAIAAGILFSIFTDGLLAGLDQESSVNMMEYETSGAKIYAGGYFEKRKTFPVNFLISRSQQAVFEKWMNRTFASVKYTLRYSAVCELVFSNTDGLTGSLNGLLYGIDPESDRFVFDTSRCVESGSWFSGTTEGTSVVLGSGIAHDLGVVVGDYITVQCKGRGGFIQTMDVPVTGIVRTGNPVVNSTAVYMDLNYLNDMLELGGAVTEVCLNLGTVAQQPASFARFDKAFAESAQTGLSVYSWQELAQDVVALQNTKSSISGIMIFFMFVISAVGVSNTILMSIMERKNEIGMLKALGYSSGYVKVLFMTEGFFIGVLGCIIGVFVSIPVTWFMVNYGIDFSGMMGDIDIGYRVSLVMHSCWHIIGFLFIPAGALCIASFSALIPAHGLLKKEIADIFRN
ncbi:MAG: FtsX-like permease family protein [Treponema sp.]|nr:FtsX-like permease family protein [Treponema sp.]